MNVSMSSTDFDDETQNEDAQEINYNDLKSVRALGCQYFSECLGGIWKEIDHKHVNVKRIR